jgi:hypothetical protein
VSREPRVERLGVGRRELHPAFHDAVGRRALDREDRGPEAVLLRRRGGGAEVRRERRELAVVLDLLCRVEQRGQLEPPEQRDRVRPPGFLRGGERGVAVGEPGEPAGDGVVAGASLRGEDGAHAGHSRRGGEGRQGRRGDRVLVRRRGSLSHERDTPRGE